MTDESPRYLFLHYWGKGKALDLAHRSGGFSTSRRPSNLSALLPFGGESTMIKGAP